MDPLSYGMVAVLILMVVFMIRNSRKQKQSREELNAKIVAGAEIMTTSGIFGTIKSIDEVENEILLETTPKVVLRIHRQAVASIVNKSAAAADAAPAAGKSAK